MGKHIERVFKNNSMKLNTASHNNASWYTDTDGFLEHSSSWGGDACTTRGLPSRRYSMFFLISPHIFTMLHYINETNKKKAKKMLKSMYVEIVVFFPMHQQFIHLLRSSIST